ncbi:MAG TPA: acetoacetate--CoA ligase, partial [Pseudonocardiaceae bacterium]|nr:acetoacetate--CoA ligase [Pseudonocardiaceae bacterium]
VSAFASGAGTVPVWPGELSVPCLGVALDAWDANGNPVRDSVGELVVTKPMPSMPVFFWNDEDGSRLREAYFETYPGIWRHGDWIRMTDRGSAVIYGRSDSTLNRGGVRMGTAEFYRVVENIDEVMDSLVIDTSSVEKTDGELLCFVVLAPGVDLSTVEPRLRTDLRQQLSPRHVPNRFVAIEAVPRTLNGKKCEVPVKKILAGVPVDKAISRDALRDPAALAPFVVMAETPS